MFGFKAISRLIDKVYELERKVDSLNDLTVSFMDTISVIPLISMLEAKGLHLQVDINYSYNRQPISTSYRVLKGGPEGACLYQCETVKEIECRSDGYIKNSKGK